MVKLVNNELYHYGTKGQKWGRRRYQNPDGTWTEEGKKRRRRGERRIGSVNSELDGDLFGGRGERMLERFSTANDSFGPYARQTSQYALDTYNLLNKKLEKGSPIDYAKYEDSFKNMSDQELRDIVSRMTAENNYVRLMTERNRSKGKAIALNVLRGTGVVLSSTAMLAATVSNGYNLYKTFRGI